MDQTADDARHRPDAAAFWARARADVDGLPAGRGLNIAHEAIVRHADDKIGDKVALHWLDVDSRRITYTYTALHKLSNRFANVLNDFDMQPGDRVFTLLGRCPELYITALGTFKNRNVYCPLFTAFGPEPIRTRLDIGKARVLVTTDTLYRNKIAPLLEALPALAHILIVDAQTGTLDARNLLDFHQCLETANDVFEIRPTSPDDAALLHFTSGTTGAPKGAVLGHAAVIAQHATARLALDLTANDIFWCTADPGWVTGTAYGIIAPLSIGATILADAQEFDAQRWCHVLESEKVTIWYTAPTAIRMMMRLEPRIPASYNLQHLRFIASVGEALHADAVRWSQRAFAQPIHDNWWQTETGCIMIANTATTFVKPGSMGKALPGTEASVIKRTDDGHVEIIEAPNMSGELALRTPWPSMFQGYVDNDAGYRACFARDWYLSGDLVKRDADDYFWFVGRADDVIKSSGHLIGPVEVERVLIEHTAVADVGVIGKPDTVAGEIVMAFIVLNPGYSSDARLKRELRRYARARLGSAIAPKAFAFVQNIPKTRSGKTLRRVLKARECGLPEGDLSTLQPQLQSSRNRSA